MAASLRTVPNIFFSASTQPRTAGRAIVRLEHAVFFAGMLVALVHFLDATTVHPQHSASGAERALQVVLAIAIPAGAAFAYARLKCGWRVATALVFGFAAISSGMVIHVVGAVKNGAGSGDYTGLAWLASGAALIILGTALMFASLPGWRWRAVSLPLAAATVMFVFIPATVAVYVTHAPRYEITAVDVGRPYEDVSFSTRDGLTIRAWYVPSQNGAAVILLHGSGGARIRPVSHARMLVDHGYGVLLVDTRGHGDSDGRTNAFGWGAWPDVEAAAGYLAARPDVRDGRVGVLGISTGAEVGLDAASRIDTLKVLVADGAGVRSINEVRSLPLTWQRALEYPSYAVSNTLVAVLSATAPPTAIEHRVRLIETPTLLISSNVAEERDINRIWRKAMPGVELWELPDTGHTGGLKKHPEEYRSRVLGFLDEYLLR